MAKQSKTTLIGKIHPDVLAFTVGQDPVLDLELAEWDCLGTAAHVATVARAAAGDSSGRSPARVERAGGAS